MSAHPKSKQIRVGIVGTGWVATARHIPAFRRDKRATVMAVLDRNLSKAESIARQYRIPRSFENMEEFLLEPLDVVSICTPPQMHAPAAEAALRSGKHVLVEKPMTLTAEEGRSLEVIADEMGVILCPAHNFLFSRSVQRAESLLRQGKAGEIQWAMGIQLSSWSRRLPSWFDELPGSLFFDEAPHLLYLMKHFLGDLRLEHSWLTTNSNSSSSRMERREVRLSGQQNNGYLATWFGAPFSEWLFILFCSRAVLVIDLFRDVLVHLPPEKAHNAGDVLKLSAQGTLRLWNGIAASGMKALRKQFLFGHDLLVKQFLDAVSNNEKSPVPARDGWKMVEFIEKILNNDSSNEC